MAGEIVTLMFVTGSVQVDVVVVVDEVEVVVVHVTAVLVAVEPHEARPKREVSSMNNRGRFTAPLSSWFDILGKYASVSTLILKM
ncbi:MAG: hypothetical protein WCA19_24490 [Candidatus Acidiferrales bacterium]